MKKEKVDSYFYYSLKFIIIGDSFVGKTKIINRLVNGKCSNHYISTIGIDFLMHNIQIDNHIFKLEIWDTAGCEKYKSITRQYYNNSACAIIVYDVTDIQSFKSVSKWVEECKSSNNPNIHLVLVGNKNDLEDKRVIKKEKGEELALQFGMRFFESSALTGNNINNIFMDSCKIINKNINNGLYDLEKQDSGVKIRNKNFNKEIKNEFIYFSSHKKLDKKNHSKKKRFNCNC